MEEVYKATKELSPVEVKVRLAAVAKYHEDLEENNKNMNEEIKSV
jgi:hypothetical protein